MKKAKKVRKAPQGRQILAEANQIISERCDPAVYGPVSESFDKIAQVCNLIFTEEELQSGEMTAEKVLKVMLAVKQIRARYSPDNPDHLRDVAGYTGLLDQVKQEAEG